MPGAGVERRKKKVCAAETLMVVWTVARATLRVAAFVSIYADVLAATPIRLDRCALKVLPLQCSSTQEYVH